MIVSQRVAKFIFNTKIMNVVLSLTTSTEESQLIFFSLQGFASQTCSFLFVLIFGSDKDTFIFLIWKKKIIQSSMFQHQSQEQKNTLSSTYYFDNVIFPTVLDGLQYLLGGFCCSCPTMSFRSAPEPSPFSNA